MEQSTIHKCRDCGTTENVYGWERSESGFGPGIELYLCFPCASKRNGWAVIKCQNPECPKVGDCGGECARNF